jgi:hypothetical protein
MFISNVVLQAGAEAGLTEAQTRQLYVEIDTV